MRRVLFLCSGNYYRSRFAELLFNARATGAGLDWVADSCALTLAPNGWRNPGPISSQAMRGLVERGIAPPENPRSPRQVCEADIRGSDLVIALKEAEHRAVVEELFPAHAARVEYWHIHDQDVCEPPQTLRDIDEQVGLLIQELRAVRQG